MVIVIVDNSNTLFELSGTNLVDVMGSSLEDGPFYGSCSLYLCSNSRLCSLFETDEFPSNKCNFLLRPGSYFLLPIILLGTYSDTVVIEYVLWRLTRIFLRDIMLFSSTLTSLLMKRRRIELIVLARYIIK